MLQLEMRYLCILLLLLVSLPTTSWARTSAMKVGKSTKLSPQQVQFMRWWRAQTIRVVKPAAKPAAKHVAKTTLTVKVTPRSTLGRSVKVVRINANTRRQVQVPIRRARKVATQVPRGHSLLTLKAVLFNAQNTPTTGFSSDSSPRRTVVHAKRRVVRRERNMTPHKTKTQRTVRHAAKKLVIVQQPSSSAPPLPNVLTRLRYQLELAQME